MELIITSSLKLLSRRVDMLEKYIISLEKRILENERIQQSQILAVYNGDQINHCTIAGMFKYCDLTPLQAMKKIEDETSNHILLDVSSKNFSTDKRPPEALHIPIEELEDRLDELDSHITNIIVISENGVKSVKACELLFKENFLSIKNVSGGYDFLVKGEDNL